MEKIGLVLTGGGARAAYQAGALRAIAEIVPEKEESPFQIVTGISAGAINGAMVAAGAGPFSETVQSLCDLWRELTPDRVIDTNVASLTKLGTRWIRDLSLGGLLGKSRSTFLLDSRPLRDFLLKTLPIENISQNIAARRLHSFAVSATSYRTGTAVTFFEGQPGIEPWQRSSRIGMSEKISFEHVLASAAIPIFFAPVQIRDSYFGDGSIRLSAPLSPAIHLGATQVLAIGMRYYRPSELTWDMNVHPRMEHITLADIAGVMLNATFFDQLDADVERMTRINQTLSNMPETLRENNPLRLREIPVLVIRPSQDLGTLASEQFSRLPGMLRYLLAGIGAQGDQGWDLLSYLAFDRAYCQPLIALGYEDVMARRAEIEEFFNPRKT